MLLGALVNPGGPIGNLKTSPINNAGLTGAGVER